MASTCARYDDASHAAERAVTELTTALSALEAIFVATTDAAAGVPVVKPSLPPLTSAPADASSSARIRELEVALATNAAQCTHLKAELAQAHDLVNELKAAALQAARDAAPTAVAAHSACLPEILEFRALLHTRSTATEERAQSCASLVSSLREAVTAVRAEHATLQAECTRVLENERTTRSDTAALRAQCTQLSLQLRVLQQERQEQAHSMELLRERVHDAEHAVALKDAAEESLARKGELLTSATSSMQAQEAALTRLRNELFELRQAAEGHDKAVAAARAEAAAEVRTLQADVDTHRREVTKLQAELVHSKSELAAQLTQCNDARDALLKCNMERGRMQLQVVDLEERVRSHTRMAARIQTAASSSVASMGGRDASAETSADDDAATSGAVGMLHSAGGAQDGGAAQGGDDAAEHDAEAEVSADVTTLVRDAVMAAIQSSEAADASNEEGEAALTEAADAAQPPSALGKRMRDEL